MNTPRSHRAFTLIELLLAVAVFAIVLAAINTVFYAAMRLERSTTQTLEAAQPATHALAFIRRDLRGAMPPGGVMAPSFKIGVVSSSAGVAQSPGIEFFAATGTITDDAPWGDVQKVTYQLRDSLNLTGVLGKELVRSVTRNLLATGMEEPEEQFLMDKVEKLEFTGFNGTDWRDTWDTTMADSGLPIAVRVRIHLASTNSGSSLNRQPLELIVPLTMQTITNTTQASTGGTGG